MRLMTRSCRPWIGATPHLARTGLHKCMHPHMPLHDDQRVAPCVEACHLACCRAAGTFVQVVRTSPVSASLEMVASSAFSGVSVVLSIVLLSTCTPSQASLAWPTHQTALSGSSSHHPSESPAHSTCDELAPTHRNRRAFLQGQTLTTLPQTIH